MSMIEVFPWNKNFETGILQIDEQHKRLVNLLNLLANHLAYQSDMSLLNTIFNELTEYSVYHFQTEEEIWQQFFADDDWKIQHKHDHDSFVETILRLKNEKGIKTFEEIMADILSFLTHWLAFHILDSDKRMAKTVLAMVTSDLPLIQAKQQAEQQMAGTMKVLIETILIMYDSLSISTLQLLREITERQKAEEKLLLAANVFNNTLDAICITDTNFNIVEANPAFYQVTTLCESDVLGKDLCLLKSGLLDQKQIDIFWNSLNESGHWSGLVHNRRKEGGIEGEWLTLSTVKTENGLISNYVAIFSNVSHLIHQQQTLEKIANHDVLTGLPNRLLLRDRLKLAIAHAERTRTILAICYVDLDGFKAVNDQLGHIAGDQLLQEMAKRFLKIARSHDTVARLGGDEFVILIGDLKNSQDYLTFLERALMEIAQTVHIDDNLVDVSASIGVTLFPEDNCDPEILLHHADQAMYQAKRLGKSRYCLYAVN